MHLNYDPTLDAEEVEQQAVTAGDYQAKAPFRRFARCWLKRDYDAALKSSRSSCRQPSGQDLDGDIEAAYDEATRREDVEVSEIQDVGRRLPTRSMRIHAEYTLYGHFYLKRLFGGIGKIRFFLDQDSGMRAACLAAFQPERGQHMQPQHVVRLPMELRQRTKVPTRMQHNTRRRAEPSEGAWR